jgi:FkbM family methyltransferase
MSAEQAHPWTNAFFTAYGRHPSSEENVQLDTYFRAVPPATPQEILRLVISIFDRQSMHTPVMVRFGEGDLRTVDLGAFKLVIDRLDYAVSLGIANQLEYEPHLTQFVKAHIKPGMTAVDIGANIGFFSMLFSTLVGPSGHVISFEPNTENCRLLLLSKTLNGFNNIDLLPLGLSNNRGAVFFTPVIGSNGTLLPNTSDTLMDPNCMVIPCERFDEVVKEHVDFIKADIEGAEYLALSGAAQTIARDKPIITIEFSMEMTNRISGINGSDFLKWVKAFGYRMEMLGRAEAGARPISDIDAFITDWGNPLRIEDLAFLPD